MTRLYVPVFLAVALGSAVVGTAQEPRFHGGVNTVSTWATVVDRDGHLVTDLTRDDFQIFDDGVEQRLTAFASDIQPITIVVMLDRSASMKNNFDLVRDAAEEFVNSLLSDDRARIGSFSNAIEIDPPTFTSDRRQLVRILHDDLQSPGPTPLWNATSAAMDALEGQNGRRVVLVFTDGRDTPGIGHNVSAADLRARAETDEVMVYAIGLAQSCGLASASPGGGGPVVRVQRRGPLGPGPFGPGGGRWPGVPRFPPGAEPPRLPLPPSGPRRSFNPPCMETGPDPELRELAAVGGGGYFELDSGEHLQSTFARIADELHHQYLLAFTAATLDNTLHRLDVRVRNPGLTVRARRGYLASSGR